MSHRLTAANAAAAAALALASLGMPLPTGAQSAQPTAAATAADEPTPSFDAAYLANTEAIKAGQEVWSTQCRHCHGNSAYPGKAPKLRPGMLEPDFIFDRVTYGFKGMPPWKAVFTLEQRKAVVAYIKSDSFSP